MLTPEIVRLVHDGMTHAQTFNQAMPVWTAEQTTPWFRLRYTTIRANLLRHLGARPLSILDVGGGNGIEAIALAELGHTVTIVDFSAEMLADARQRAEAAGVAERIILHEADVSTLATLLPGITFDAVLCHNVLQYVPDPEDVLHTMAALVHPGGLLSVVCPNRYGETYLAALLQFDLTKALAQLDAPTVDATLFNVAVHRFSGDDMRQRLGEVGFTAIEPYGILCVCGYIANNDLKYDPAFFAQLEQLELALTDRYPYYLLARFSQLIAWKAV